MTQTARIIGIMRQVDPFRQPEKLARVVYAYVAYRIGPGAAAEDVTSETFVRGLRARATYDRARGTPEALMIGIARRVIADLADDREVLVADLADRPDDGFEARAVDRRTVADAMRHLTARERELLALRYGADLTAAQIAELLESEPHAVEVALSRAVSRLRSFATVGSDL